MRRHPYQLILLLTALASSGCDFEMRKDRWNNGMIAGAERYSFLAPWRYDTITFESTVGGHEIPPNILLEFPDHHLCFALRTLNPDQLGGTFSQEYARDYHTGLDFWKPEGTEIIWPFVKHYYNDVSDFVFADGKLVYFVIKARAKDGANQPALWDSQHVVKYILPLKEDDLVHLFGLPASTVQR